MLIDIDDKCRNYSMYKNGKHNGCEIPVNISSRGEDKGIILPCIEPLENLRTRGHLHTRKIQSGRERDSGTDRLSFFLELWAKGYVVWRFRSLP